MSARASSPTVVGILLPLLTAAGCVRQSQGESGERSSDSEPPADDTASTEALSVSWGDLHAHSGLSFDGCEDAAAQCLPRGTSPGADFFENAATNGLDFAAMTDHAEFVSYSRPADGVTVDIWDSAREIVATADGGPVIPILGYEWTADSADPSVLGAHRTVLLEDPAACPEYRVQGYAQRDLKFDTVGLEAYTANPAPEVPDARDLQAALDDAGALPGCANSRWVSFLHHVAEDPPASVHWTDPALTLDSDTVVEIASEHGSSECTDPSASGCEWHLNSDVYQPDGTVQTALAQGEQLGFVGGTDRHDGQPGRLDLGPSASGHLYDEDGDGTYDDAYLQHTTGTLTGVISELPLTRAAIFDALEARHTLVASWPATALWIEASSANGSHLPGDEVPAGPIVLQVTLEDPEVSDWSGLLIGPDGTGIPIGSGDSAPDYLVLDTSVLAPGSVSAFYVRIDATVNGESQRAWASPFFIRTEQ